MNPAEDRLAAALRERADRIGRHDQPLTVATVTGRARQIRRRRVAASGLAAAAVLAVTVPLGIGFGEELTGRPDSGPMAPSPSTTFAPDPSPSVSTDPTPTTGTRTPDQSDGESQGPSPDASPDQTPQGPPGVTLLDASTSAVSGPPRIGVWYDGAVHAPGGATAPVSGGFWGFAPYDGGWLTVTDGVLTFHDTSGATQQLATGVRDAFAVSTDGTVVAWVGQDGTAYRLSQGGSEPVAFPPLTDVGQALAASALQGCGGSSAGCRLFASAQSGLAGQAYVSVDGTTDEVPGLWSVEGTSVDGLISGVTSVRGDNSVCSAVVDLTQVLWPTCDFKLGRFSPDGRYVLGHPEYGSGAGDASLAVLDARTGAVVTQVRNDENTQAFITSTAWDVDGTVLMTVSQGGVTHLMRLAPDGTLSHAGDAERSWDEGSSLVPVRLPLQP